jgi:hypothetical protein
MPIFEILTATGINDSVFGACAAGIPARQDRKMIYLFEFAVLTNQEAEIPLSRVKGGFIPKLAGRERFRRPEGCRSQSLHRRGNSRNEQAESALMLFYRRVTRKGRRPWGHPGGGLRRPWKQSGWHCLCS